jgi:hypothetical protein
MTANSKFKFGYRMMQVALVVGCLSLVANLVEQHNRAAQYEVSSSRFDQQVEQSGKLLSDTRKQRDEVKQLLIQAQTNLADVEKSTSAKTAKP